MGAQGVVPPIVNPHHCTIDGRLKGNGLHRAVSWPLSHISRGNREATPQLGSITTARTTSCGAIPQKQTPVFQCQCLSEDPSPKGATGTQRCRCNTGVPNALRCC